MILFLYFYINILMTGLYLLNKKYIYIFFQIKQKTVQTLLKWLFWTSINLDIILAEVFVSIPCVG